MASRWLRFIFQLPAISGRAVRASAEAISVAPETSMPGRSLPSRYSRLAPPPVEMCPKAASSKPSVRTAAAESPPPTTDRPSTSVERLGHRPGALGERVELEDAHRAVPEDRPRVGERVGERRAPSPGRCRGPSWSAGIASAGDDGRAAASAVNSGGDHDVGRQQDLRRRTPRPAAGSRGRCRAGPPRAGSCRPRGPGP